MLETKSIDTDFRFHLEFTDEQGEVVREQQVNPAAFAHAIRHARFDAFRRGRVAEYQPLANGARVEPLFPVGHSPSPRAKGFQVTIPLPGGGDHACEFDIGYFRSQANRLQAELLRTEVMTSDDPLYYRLNAFIDEGQPVPPANKLAISFEPVTQAMEIGPGRRRDFGPAEAWDEPDADALPVLVDESVLEEIVQEAKAEPECEIAGFLLGHVRHDEERNEVFVAVTGLASAGGTTEASCTSVTYQPASFARARDIIKLRGAGETICGWYHSHPFKLCAECPRPARPECIEKVLFYSLDDMDLMETTFDQPFMVGLLAAVDPRIEEFVGHLPVKLYGWHNGEIKQRGFEVVRAGDR